jgi:purine-binding chemotaxis protein CheW
MTLDEENAGQSGGDVRADGGGQEGLEERAASLVNPRSGIANDYLNHFNEVFLLIENLPILLPEMLDELMAWKPVTYREYFQKSLLPGSAQAIAIYDRLDEGFRNEFEAIIKSVNAIALASVQVIGNHRSPSGEIDPEQVSEFCENSSRAMRSALNRAADLVNNGRGEVIETPQEMVERILNVAEAANFDSGAAEGPPSAEAPQAASVAETVAEVAPPAPESEPEPEPEPVRAAAPKAEAPKVEAPRMEAPVIAKAAAPPAPEASAGEARAKGTNSAVPSAGDESYFTVFAGGEAFGLSVLHAQTIFRIGSITPIPMGPVDIVGLVNLRGRIVTAVSLRRRLGIPVENVQNPLAIVIDHKGENFALMVDEVGDVISLDASMRVPVPNHFDHARRRLMTDLYKVGNLLVPVLNVSTLFDFSLAAA